MSARALGSIGTSLAETSPSPCATHTTTPASLDHFLDTSGFGEKESRRTALARLDDGDQPEALVYLLGDDWCGSGGCTLLVLRQRNGSWTRVSRITATRLPVRLLDRRRHGWHSLQVHIGGGGITSADAVLDFDGHHYPGNPTVLPPAAPNVGVGRTLIDFDGTVRCPR